MRRGSRRWLAQIPTLRSEARSIPTGRLVELAGKSLPKYLVKVARACFGAVFSAVPALRNGAGLWEARGTASASHGLTGTRYGKPLKLYLASNKPLHIGLTLPYNNRAFASSCASSAEHPARWLDHRIEYRHKGP